MSIMDSLTQRLGPLPVYVWVGIGAAGLVAVKLATGGGGSSPLVLGAGSSAAPTSASAGGALGSYFGAIGDLFCQGVNDLAITLPDGSTLSLGAATPTVIDTGQTLVGVNPFNRCNPAPPAGGGSGGNQPPPVITPPDPQPPRGPLQFIPTTYDDGTGAPYVINRPNNYPGNPWGFPIAQPQPELGHVIQASEWASGLEGITRQTYG